MAVRLRGEALDAAILDSAARIFAARGFAATSVQSVADATGYSKAAILARYRSKDLLFSAVVSRCQALAAGMLDRVAPIEHGPLRDDRAIEVFADTALANPGSIALLLAGLVSVDGQTRAPLEQTTPVLWRMFDGLPLDSYVDDPAHLDPAELERRVRVVGALGAIGTVVAAAGSALPVPGLRPLVLRAAQHVLRS